jgi:hypothetical protein
MKAKSLRCNRTQFWSFSIKIRTDSVHRNFLFQFYRISWFLWLNLFSTLSPYYLNYSFDVSLFLSRLNWVNNSWIATVSKASRRPSDLLAQITIIDWLKVSDLSISVSPSNCFKNSALNWVIDSNSWSSSLELVPVPWLCIKTPQVIKLIALINAHYIGDELCAMKTKGILVIDWKYRDQYWIHNRYQSQSLFNCDSLNDRGNCNNWITSNDS